MGCSAAEKRSSAMDVSRIMGGKAAKGLEARDVRLFGIVGFATTV